jgi:hypothetical protein
MERPSRVNAQSQPPIHPDSTSEKASRPLPTRSTLESLGDGDPCESLSQRATECFGQFVECLCSTVFCLIGSICDIFRYVAGCFEYPVSNEAPPAEAFVPEPPPEPVLKLTVAQTIQNEVLVKDIHSNILNAIKVWSHDKLEFPMRFCCIIKVFGGSEGSHCTNRFVKMVPQNIGGPILFTHAKGIVAQDAQKSISHEDIRTSKRIEVVFLGLHEGTKDECCRVVMQQCTFFPSGTITPSENRYAEVSINQPLAKSLGCSLLDDEDSLYLSAIFRSSGKL